MYETKVKIDGMMCGMCESHINDAIRNAFSVKKVSASHSKGEADIISEEPIDEAKLRETITVPMVYMTYANVVFSYGCEKFAQKAADAGIDGLILPDVPYEEKEEFTEVFDRYGLDLISMIAPTSEDRIAMIAKEAKGFIYMVSSLGVTGTRSEITTDISAMTDLVKKNSEVPCAVGFGISTPEQAARMAELSDGAIVGSAIIKIIAKYGKEAAGPVGEYVKEMADAVHGV